MPKGLKPVRKRLATGQLRIYWYHRATGKRLKHAPESAEGLLEVRALDDSAKVQTAVSAALAGSYADLWTKYRASPEWRALRPRTRSDYQAVRDWLGEAAEKRTIATLTSGQVIGLRDKAATQKGRRFANYVVQVLRLTLEWGRLRDVVKANPAMGVRSIRRPSDAKRVNRAWLEDELRVFFAGAPFQLSVPAALGAFAGMRQGDALRVTWSAYDGTHLRWRASKNGEDCIISVGEPLHSILEEAKARRGKAVQIAVNSEGAPWSASGFRASFFKRIRDLKETHAVGAGLSFHGLRHFVGKSAREAGESESRVAAAIGDRSLAMAQTYGRDADQQAAQIDVIGDLQKRYANLDWKPASPDWKPRRAK